MRTIDTLPMRRWGRLDRVSQVPTAEELHREFPGLELPVLSLGMIVVAEDTVIVSGTINADVAATAELKVNGHRVPVAEWGSFCVNVRLVEGDSALKLSLKTNVDRVVTLDLPLRAF